MERRLKQELRVASAERLKNAKAVVLAEYRGLTVEQLTKLRVELRKVNAEFRISKNRILRRAIDEEGKVYEPIKQNLKGPLGVVYSYGDAAPVAKSLLDFEKDNELFVIKSGFMEGNVFDKEAMKSIASLPPKEVLLAKALGSLQSPARGIVSVLIGVPRQVVQVINAIKEKKEKQVS